MISRVTATTDKRDTSAKPANSIMDPFFLSQKVLADTYNQILEMLLFGKEGQRDGLSRHGRFGRYGHYYYGGCLSGY